jgi:hypothetical protein
VPTILCFVFWGSSASVLHGLLTLPIFLVICNVLERKERHSEVWMWFVACGNKEKVNICTEITSSCPLGSLLNV